MAARSARAHQENSARARPSAWAVNSRLGQLAAARAHREDSARARRGQVTLSVTAAAVPASRLPPRVMQPSGLRPSPTDAAAETGRWATSHRDVAAPKGGAK